MAAAKPPSASKARREQITLLGGPRTARTRRPERPSRLPRHVNGDRFVRPIPGQPHLLAEATRGQAPDRGAPGDLHVGPTAASVSQTVNGVTKARVGGSASSRVILRSGPGTPRAERPPIGVRVRVPMTVPAPPRGLGRNPQRHHARGRRTPAQLHDIGPVPDRPRLHVQHWLERFHRGRRGRRQAVGLASRVHYG